VKLIQKLAKICVMVYTIGLAGRQCEVGTIYISKNG